MIGEIFKIQRFSLQDGPGIRTTVFFKGCPLHCLWCHNPEGKTAGKSLFYQPSLCISCGECTVCPTALHRIIDGTHRFERSGCISCGKCAEKCPTGALECVGKTVTVNEVIAEVLRDKPFYSTEGGITLSGGEPMAQPEFAKEIAKTAKENGLSVCLETSGFCGKDALVAMIPHIDFFLFDFKAQSECYKAYTGKDGKVVFDNLRILNENRTNIALRCPIVLGINDNDEHITAIIDCAKTHTAICEIHLMPYHAYGLAKYQSLSLTTPFFETQGMPKEIVHKYAKRIACQTGIKTSVF